VPSALRDPTLDKFSIFRRINRPFPRMTPTVAYQTCCSDVIETFIPAVAFRLEMLASALKRFRLRPLELVCLAKDFGVAEPHQTTAIAAAAALTSEGDGSRTREFSRICLFGRHTRLLNVERKPRSAHKATNGNQPAQPSLAKPRCLNQGHRDSNLATHEWKIKHSGSNTVCEWRPPP